MFLGTSCSPSPLLLSPQSRIPCPRISSKSHRTEGTSQEICRRLRGWSRSLVDSNCGLGLPLAPRRRAPAFPSARTLRDRTPMSSMSACMQGNTRASCDMVWQCFGGEIAYDLGAELLKLSVIAEAEVDHNEGVDLSVAVWRGSGMCSGRGESQTSSWRLLMKLSSAVKLAPDGCGQSRVPSADPAFDRRRGI